MTRSHNRNRLWIVLLTVAVAIALALPAGAAPPCSVNPNHPNCIPDDPTDPPPDDEPLAGTTCEAIGEWGNPVESDFEITLDDDACIDVIASPGDWTVAVEESGAGTLRHLSLVVRDSVAPGDACDSVAYRRVIPSQITLDGLGSEIPGPGIAGAWVNSCGTDWAEWVGDVYYAEEDESVPSPLVLQVFMTGKDAKVKLTIDLPDPPALP